MQIGLPKLGSECHGEIERGEGSRLNDSTAFEMRGAAMIVLVMAESVGAIHRLDSTP